MGRTKSHATPDTATRPKHPAICAVVAFNRILNAETDSAAEHTVVLGEVGAAVHHLRCRLETNRRDPLKHMTVFLRAPSGKCGRVTHDPDKLAREFRGQRVNGIWTVRLHWSPARKRRANGEILVRKVRLEFGRLDRVTLLAETGPVTTILGDGTLDRLRDGQAGTASLGGRPSALRYDARGDVVVAGLEQGCLAKWQRDANRVALQWTFAGDWGSVQPMGFDQDPRRPHVYWAAVYQHNAVAEVDTKVRAVRWHLRGVVDKPVSCSFAVSASGTAQDELYVCDTGHHQVLKYHVRTRAYSSVLGVRGTRGTTDEPQALGRCLLDFPVGVSVHKTYLVVACAIGNRVVGANLHPLRPGFIGGRAVGPGLARTIVGSGATMNPRAKDVFDVAVTPARRPHGRLYARSAAEVEVRWPFCPRFLVADRGGFAGDFVFVSAGSGTVEYVTNGGVIMTVCGPGENPATDQLSPTPASQARLGRPMSLDVRMPTRDQVSLVIADTDSCCVREVTFRLRLEQPQAARGGVSDQKMGMETRYTDYGKLYGSFGFLYALYFVPSSQVRPKFVCTGSRAPVLTATDPWGTGRGGVPTTFVPGLYLLRYVVDPNRVATVTASRRGVYSEFWLLLQGSRRGTKHQLAWDVIWKIGTPSVSRRHQLDGDTAWANWESLERIKYAAALCSRRKKKAPVREQKGSGRKRRQTR